VEAVRTHSGVLMFVIVLVLLGVVYHTEVWVAVIPVITMYAFSGLAELLTRFGRQHLLHSASFVLTGLLLVHLQFDYYRVNKPAMTEAVGQTDEIHIVAEWLKINSAISQTVCAERSFTLEYYAERPIALMKQHDELCGDLIVTSRRDFTGYEVLFKPEPAHNSVEIPFAHYAVWRKR
jgi:hypothetical protein